MTAEGLREKARELEAKLGDDCEHSSEYGMCLECSVELFIEAMTLALEEAERAVSAEQAGWTTGKRTNVAVWDACDNIRRAIASLRSGLGSGLEGEER